MRQVKTSLSQKFKLIEPDLQKCRDRARTGVEMKGLECRASGPLPFHCRNFVKVPFFFKFGSRGSIVHNKDLNSLGLFSYMKHPSVWKCYQSQVPKSFPSRLPGGDRIDEQKTPSGWCGTELKPQSNPSDYMVLICAQCCLWAPETANTALSSAGG